MIGCICFSRVHEINTQYECHDTCRCTRASCIKVHSICYIAPLSCQLFLWYVVGGILYGEGKVHPRTGREGPRGGGEESTLSFTSVVVGGGWLTPPSGSCIPLKETPCLLYMRLCVSQHRLMLHFCDADVLSF